MKSNSRSICRLGVLFLTAAILNIAAPAEAQPVLTRRLADGMAGELDEGHQGVTARCGPVMAIKERWGGAGK